MQNELLGTDWFVAFILPAMQWLIAETGASVESASRVAHELEDTFTNDCKHEGAVLDVADYMTRSVLAY